MILRRKGDKNKYEFADKGCLGRTCFAPGLFQVRGGTMSGSRNTGKYLPCCMNRAYRGCPDGPVGQEIMADGSIRVGLPVIDLELAKQRKAEGWK